MSIRSYVIVSLDTDTRPCSNKHNSALLKVDNLIQFCIRDDGHLVSDSALRGTWYVARCCQGIGSLLQRVSLTVAPGDASMFQFKPADMRC
jgi:hypothetical protein